MSESWLPEFRIPESWFPQFGIPHPGSLNSGSLNQGSLASSTASRPCLLPTNSSSPSSTSPSPSTTTSAAAVSLLYLVPFLASPSISPHSLTHALTPRAQGLSALSHRVDGLAAAAAAAAQLAPPAPPARAESIPARTRAGRALSRREYVWSCLCGLMSISVSERRCAPAYHVNFREIL